METEFSKEEWDVRGIAADDAKEWVLYKHYAHRLPSITFAFGLYRIGGGKVPHYQAFALSATLSLPRSSRTLFKASIKIRSMNLTAYA